MITCRRSFCKCKICKCNCQCNVSLSVNVNINKSINENINESVNVNPELLNAKQRKAYDFVVNWIDKKTSPGNSVEQLFLNEKNDETAIYLLNKII